MKTASIEHLRNSPEFQLFIRGPTDFLRAANEVSKPSNSEILTEMDRNFHQYSTPESIPDSAFEQPYEYFKQGLEKLKKFERVCENIVRNYSTFTQEHSHLLEGINQISEFQNNYFGSQKIDIPTREMYSNPYWVLLDWVRTEILDLNAIIQTVESRNSVSSELSRCEHALSKLESDQKKTSEGKKSLSQILSSKTPEERSRVIQASIHDQEEKIQSLKSLLNLISNKMLTFDIPRFKQQKANKFEVVMRSFSGSATEEFNYFIEHSSAIEQKLS